MHMGYKMQVETKGEQDRSRDAYMLQQMSYYGAIVATGSCYALLNINFLNDISLLELYPTHICATKLC